MIKKLYFCFKFTFVVHAYICVRGNLGILAVWQLWNFLHAFWHVRVYAWELREFACHTYAHTRVEFWGFFQCLNFFTHTYLFYQFGLYYSTCCLVVYYLNINIHYGAFTMHYIHLRAIYNNCLTFMLIKILSTLKLIIWLYINTYQVNIISYFIWFSMYNLY